MSSYNKQRDIAVGLEIFMRHGGKFADAQHDILFAAQADRGALTQAEVTELQRCGWFHSSELGCDCQYQEDEEVPLLPRDAVADDNGVHHLLTSTNWAIFT